jgi:hypothetical protein
VFVPTSHLPGASTGPPPFRHDGQLARRFGPLMRLASRRRELCGVSRRCTASPAAKWLRESRQVAEADTERDRYSTACGLLSKVRSQGWMTTLAVSRPMSRSIWIRSTAVTATRARDCRPSARWPCDIFDRNDDLGSAGVIPFEPFLSEPDPNTPTPPTTTTSSTTTTTIWSMPPTTSTTMPIGGTPPTTSTMIPNTSLHASLAVTPVMVLTGQPVAFDASGSTPLSTITHYEWDFDGDGTFETDTGAVPVVSRSYSEPGELRVRVRVTADNGMIDTAEGTLAVRLAPPEGPVGVSINGGAQYTNDPNVTVSVRWPAFATSLLISNDGGFTQAVAFPVAASIPWTLDSSGPERLPKTIYVRFQGGSSGPETYQDDIILDQTPPTIEGVRAAGRGSGEAHRYRLHIRASDDLSGVGQMQITNDTAEPGDLVPFQAKTEVRSSSRKLLVRVQDLAGNFSPWRKVRR